jgi:N-ethylmaleimide reductase
MKSSQPLEPIDFGPYKLKNRVVMGAMTRCRSDPKDGIPNDLHIQYYSERAEDTGLILTECSAISRRGNCHPGAANIYTKEQAEGWKRVCEATHKVGGVIYLQIWHAGRTAFEELTGLKPVGPSSISVRELDSNNSIVYKDIPEELTEDGIKEILNEFRESAMLAKEAGFDGIQLHGANGHLVDQFLRDATNKRTDSYGGSIVNRCKFALEVIDTLILVFGSDRVGIKLSPAGRFMDMYDSDPIPLYKHLLIELDKRSLSFIELESAVNDKGLYEYSGSEQIPDVFETFRPFFSGVLIGGGGLNWEDGNKLVEKGIVDMISYATYYVANPDLVERFKNGWKLAKYDLDTLFLGGKEGYIYPKYK